MNKKGRILIIIGIVLLCVALGLTGFNVFSAYIAQKKSKDVVTKMSDVAVGDYPDYKLNPHIEMPLITVDGRDYIGKLIIPKFDLKLPIQSKWDYDNLTVSPCRYSGSVYLDNLIICAHNYYGHFGRLNQLSVGDEVAVEDNANNVFRYRVTELETLAPTAVEDMKKGNYGLTLFTCTVGGRTRVTVRCEKTGK